MPPKSSQSTPSSSGKQPAITSFFKRIAPATPTASAASNSSNIKQASHADDDDVQEVAHETPAKNFSSRIQTGSGGKVSKSQSSSPEEDKSTKENGTASRKRFSKPSMRRPVAKALDSSQDEAVNESRGDPDFKVETGSLEFEKEASGVVKDNDSAAESEVESVESVSTPQKRKLTTKAKDRKVTKRFAHSAPAKPSRRGSNVKKLLPKTAAPKKGKAKPFDQVEDADEDEGVEVMDQESNDGLEVLKRTHETLDWLAPDKIRDKQGVLHKNILARGKDSGGEEKPRTLKVPPLFLDTCTPGLRQWWEMKSDNYDCILFFKLGKFYEMYHMDADVGVKELNLIYMKGNHAHCGFPEGAFSLYANRLVAKGYRVMRVEQTMTAQQLKDSDRKLKTMPRENIRIYTPGTRSVNTLESEVDMKEDLRKSADASCLLVLAERVNRLSEGAEEFEYGVCVLYASASTFLIGQFKEDRYHSRLRTLLAHHAPNEIVLERNRTSPQLNQILRSSVLSANKEYLTPSAEFYDAKRAVTLLLEGEYFGPILDPQWPPALANMLKLGGSVPSPKNDCDLAVRALGTCAGYLRRCQIDFELLSQKNIIQYNPSVQLASDGPLSMSPKHMVLDGVTLLNLDIIQNPSDGSNGKCLLTDLDRCKTKFGRRLLKDWLVAPLCRVPDIIERQLAVHDLTVFRREHDKEYSLIVDLLKGLPNFERLLSKIHVVGSFKRNKDHPETRAVMFDDKVYSKRKIADFLATIEAFRKVIRTVRDYGKYFSSAESPLVRDIFTMEAAGGTFPDLQPVLVQFTNAFDAQLAAETGKITPKPGVDEIHDEAAGKVQNVLDELEKYRSYQSKKFQCSIKFFHQARNRYQMELPDDACGHMPHEYTKKSTRKGFQRFWTKVVEDLLEKLVQAEEKLAVALKDCTRRVFEKFDNHYVEWSKAVRCITTLDVLISLEEYSANLVPSCVPIFTEPSIEQRPFLAIRDGRHPLIVSTFFGGEFIPNDSYIGTADNEKPDENGQCVLVTGPNMGGKSTLMRQIGLICVLAQLGVRVPAVSCEMTPVDRIFTRIGASDNLLAGESTFLVELSETSSVLQHATRNSLVLMDELGRGTATFDGTAIAAAVLDDLAKRIQCRTVFSTHYHSLVERFEKYPEIKLGHLGCQVENENDEDPTKETITLLYKFVHGACPKSYGFNAARLAGVSNEVIKRAHDQARKMEQRMIAGKLA